MRALNRDRVRALLGTPGQRIAYDPSGGSIVGAHWGLTDPSQYGSELRTYRTCPPGGAVWIVFYRQPVWIEPPVPHMEWFVAIRIEVGHFRPYPAMWWFN